jgi:hypothetical protein
MARATFTMQQMYDDLMERRKSLTRKESGSYQYSGQDKFSVLYFNQMRDAAFAKAKIPPFGDGQVEYQLDTEPVYTLPPMPANMTLGEWKQIYRAQYLEHWKDWNRKKTDLDKQYLEACGIILTMLGPEPLAEVQQYTTIADGKDRFDRISDLIRKKYYPSTSLEIETLQEWISKSSDEFGIKIWFSLWQEAIDLLTVVRRRSIPKRAEFMRFMETGMTNRELKLYFDALRVQSVPDDRVNAIPGAMRKRRWDEVRDELLIKLDADPGIEAHIKASPKSSISANQAVMEKKFPYGTCFNCGDKNHMMKDCKSLSCSRCNKTWSSEHAIGFHRCGDRDKCPLWDPNYVSKSRSSSRNQPKKSENLPYGSVRPDARGLTKKAFKARYKAGKDEGFQAALAMIKAGKSVAELEISALGKRTSTA